MRRLRIAIDIDDVLAENAAGFVAFSNRRWGTKLTVDDYDEHWAKMWQVDKEETERRAAEYFASESARGYGHIGGALEVLERISSQHHIMIATSRRIHMKHDTIEWVEEHFPGVFSSTAIYFAGIWDNIKDNSHKITKAELVNKIDADVLIDDQLKHCIAVAEQGRHALLFGDYAWNRAEELPDFVTRCHNWQAVEAAIDRLANQ